eukprot:366276-Chlamydomonas_euryale.AAC.1
MGAAGHRSRTWHAPQPGLGIDSCAAGAAAGRAAGRELCAPAAAHRRSQRAKDASAVPHSAPHTVLAASHPAVQHPALHMFGYVTYCSPALGNTFTKSPNTLSSQRSAAHPAKDKAKEDKGPHPTPGGSSSS